MLMLPMYLHVTQKSDDDGDDDDDDDDLPPLILSTKTHIRQVNWLDVAGIYQYAKNIKLFLQV